MQVPSLLYVALALVACDPNSTFDPDGGTESDTETGSETESDTEPWGGLTVDDAYSVDRIVLVKTINQQGFTAEYYENRAYTCGIKGYQTFVIAYREDLPLTTERPLWVRMHGGGVGTYNSDGNYVPVEQVGANNQESFTRLAKLMTETGLMSLVRGHRAGFRFLMPSLCDHDVYSGIGIPDVNNPNSPDENDVMRAADGLLATKAAIAFTRARVDSTHVFLQGTSAGSIGSFSVAYSFGREGVGLSGIVSDSHVLGRGVQDNGRLYCMPYPYDVDLLLAKVGPLASAEFFPEDIVDAGELATPVYHLWNQGDPACCGSDLQEYTDSDGNTYRQPGCEHEHAPYGEAITAKPPGGAGRSVSVRVCVNAPGTPAPMACDLHSPTKDRARVAEPAGDQLSDGADYNEAIMGWVGKRLKDPVPQR